jgi:hypothetical protein
MKKFLDLFKLKKSKVVEELTKDFDKKVETQKKVNEEYSKNKINHDLIFKSLMHDDFYHEINDLMAHFDKQLNPLHKGDKCGFRVDKSIYELTFHNGGYDNFPVSYKYDEDTNNIKVHDPEGNRGGEFGGKLFSVKESREAEKHFLKLMTKHMEVKIK